MLVLKLQHRNKVGIDRNPGIEIEYFVLRHLNICECGDPDSYRDGRHARKLNGISEKE